MENLIIHRINDENSNINYLYSDWKRILEGNKKWYLKEISTKTGPGGVPSRFSRSLNFISIQSPNSIWSIHSVFSRIVQCPFANRQMYVQKMFKVWLNVEIRAFSLAFTFADENESVFVLPWRIERFWPGINVDPVRCYDKDHDTDPPGSRIYGCWRRLQAIRSIVDVSCKRMTLRQASLTKARKVGEIWCPSIILVAERQHSIT